jgi:hypothetical protein
MSPVKIANKLAIGYTTFKNETFVKLTKLLPKHEEDKQQQKDKKRSNPNTISIPLRCVETIVKSAKQWFAKGQRVEKEIVNCEWNTKKLMKLADKENFHTSMTEQDDGVSDLILYHEEFKEKSQTSVYATLLFIRYDRVRKQALQRPVMAFLLTKYPNSKQFQQRVGAQTIEDVALLITSLEQYLKKLNHQFSADNSSDSDEDSDSSAEHCYKKRKITSDSSESETSDDSDQERRKIKRMKVVSDDSGEEDEGKIKDVTTTSQDRPSTSKTPVQWGSGASSLQPKMKKNEAKAAKKNSKN